MAEQSGEVSESDHKNNNNIFNHNRTTNGAQEEVKALLRARGVSQDQWSDLLFAALLLHHKGSAEETVLELIRIQKSRTLEEKTTPSTPPVLKRPWLDQEEQRVEEGVGHKHKEPHRGGERKRDREVHTVHNPWTSVDSTTAFLSSSLPTASTISTWTSSSSSRASSTPGGAGGGGGGVETSASSDTSGQRPRTSVSTSSGVDSRLSSSVDNS